MTPAVVLQINYWAVVVAAVVAFVGGAVWYKKRLAQKVRTALPGPEPAKGPGGQQAVDKTINDVLNGHTPWLARPDGVDQLPHAIGQERRCSRHAKDRQIGRSGRNRASGAKER